MDLPNKDKNGVSYLSYSQIALFKRDYQEYYERYILKVPFQGNAYTDFGTKVGEALEKGDFSKFDIEEQKVLSKVERLDEFEKEVRLNYDGFYIKGFIDTNKFDYSKITDYKTGGNNKEHQYKEDSYTQLCYYALSIRQEYNITPKVAQVHFIRRSGNAFVGEDLKVAEGCDPIVIDIDISYERLKSVYWETLEVVKQIEQFYKDNNPN